ncbi:hypothetical protein CK203_030527 [Vitis vinifera]|uniref:Retrotransposon gag domain-containing protein n=1 Tax=Vitis vinifera TaxID=29760 RepID=A0A438JDL2_VITVI|nr:hypothetical protein CK203_030527 [Vitis vinifera]
MRENFVKSMQCKLKLKYMKSFGALHSLLPSQSEMQERKSEEEIQQSHFRMAIRNQEEEQFQTTSEDDFSGDEWLGFTFLGVMEARFSFKSLKSTLNGQYLLCMPYWIRDIEGRLVKIETPQEVELEVCLNIMDVPPKDQNSQLGQENNFNAYRSMRDRMHPPRMSAPSCIVPPTEQLVIRPHIVPLLPTFHGMESENPYSHIKEFEEVCNTFQEGGASIDLMRLKLFPFTLKDKAKIWLNSLRPRTKENERFYECWERYMEAINACPHHGFDTWLLVSYFYDGKVVAMARRLEELEMKKHLVEECPTIPAVREMFGDQANVIGQFKPNNNASYGNTYNSNWRNHPNFAWKPKPPQYTQPTQSPQQASNLEQAIVNLSKVVGDFVGDQKSINAQLNQRIDSVKSTLNKRMDVMQNNLSQKIGNVQYVISRLTNLNTVQEKGKFPSQPHQNPKGIHEEEAKEGESSKVREVKAVITLRSGKEVDQPTSKPKHDEKSVEEKEKSEEMKGKRKGISTKKDDHDSSVDEELERIVIKEDMMKKHMPPPFPQALHGKKGTNNASKFFKY